MVRYRGVGANPRITAERFCEMLLRSGYKARVQHSAASSRVVYKKGFLGREHTVVFRGAGNDLIVEASSISEEVMQILDDAVLSCSSNPSAFRPYRELAMEEAARYLQYSPFGGLISRAMGLPQPAAQPPPTTQPAPAVQTPQPVAPRTLECPNCGAPLTIDPEEIIVTCPYCGYTINMSGKPIARHSMLPLLISGSQAIEIAKDYAAKGIFTTRGMAERAEWGDIMLYWVPVWLFTVNVRGYVEGRRALVATRDVKKQILEEVGLNLLGSALGSALGGLGQSAYRSLDRARVERREIYETLDVPVVARKSAMFQLEPGKWRVPVERKEPFRRSVQGEVLGVELSEDVARQRAVSEALETIRFRYTILHRFDVDATVVGEGELLHSPFWFVRYVMGGREYCVVVDGCSGQVVAGQRPWLPPIRRGGTRGAV